MTHSTPQPVGDRLKHGPLSGQNLGEVYRKTATIRAVQWFKDGDHPAVVRKSDPSRYADEGVPWCPTLEGGHVVTPGDWVATGVQGEHWPIKPDVFAATYELITTPATREDGASGADGEREVGCSEPQVGRAVYRRIETLLVTDPQGWERAYLSHLVESVEEVGGYDGPLSPDQPSARERRLEEALAKAVEAVSDAIEWDKQRGYRMPYRVRDPLYAVLAADEALAHNQEGGR